MQLNTKRNRSATTVVLLVVALLSAAAVAVGAAQVADQGRDSGPVTSAQTHRDRGKAYYEEKQYDDAIAAFDAVTHDAGVTAQDWLNLALAYYKNNQDPEAAQAVAAAIAIDPEHPGLWYLQGLIEKRAGDLEDALVSLLKASELDATDPAIRYNLGAVHAQIGDVEAAQVEFATVIGMGFDIGLQHYVSSLYRSFQLLLRAGSTDREALETQMNLYRSYQQRLSAAAKTAAALEASRYTVIRVPVAAMAPATPESAARIALREGPTVTRSTNMGLADSGFAVGDVDGDTRLDLVVGGPGGGVWLRRDDGFQYREIDLPAGPMALGDADRDGSPDLFVADPDGDRFYLNRAAGAADGPLFEPANLDVPTASAPTSVLWIDYDHDGDLDVLVTHGVDATGAAVADRLLNNRGGGEFVDASAAAGIDTARSSRVAVWGDFDADSDVDLLIARGDGSDSLYSNARGGSFDEIGRAVGIPSLLGTEVALVEDFDNDGALDVILGGEHFVALRNTGDGTFLPIEVPEFEGLGATGPLSLLAADLNNDGWIDVIAGDRGAAVLLVNGGDWRFARARALEGVPGRVLLAADEDFNGALDLLVEDDSGIGWLHQEEPVGTWLSLSLHGMKNNIAGVGAILEVKAEDHYQLRPLRSAPLHFGIGDLSRVDIVRITWPNGIVQNMLDVEAEQSLLTEELERLEGSCPMLYAWDGERFRFVNEVLGVAPLGMPVADGVIHPADFDEYVPVSGAALKPHDGFYELRFTEELREAGYLDAVRLLAVDHPRDVRIVPDERFVPPPHPEFRLFAVADERPVEAVDQRGVVWTEALAAVDEEWAVPFSRGVYDGLASPHHLELRLPDAGAPRRGVDGTGPRVHLFLTGWVYWATGSINVVVDQDSRVEFTPVSLLVPDGRGGWRVAIEDIGLPNAKNSTIRVDLTSHLIPEDPRVRLATTMRLYWDAATYTVDDPLGDGLVPTDGWQQEWGVPRPGRLDLRADGVDDPASLPARVTVIEPAAAQLRFRGFSRLVRTEDGFETFDYGTVLATAPWNQHPGSYTRYGDVSELVVDADDRFVVLGTGDEVSIRFRADLPELAPGWSRDYLVYLNGWVKDGDPNTLMGDRVEPLPFHAMSSYPYGPDEQYPDTPMHRHYEEVFNTRPGLEVNASLLPGDVDPYRRRR